MNDNDYDQGVVDGYTTAINYATQAINQHLADRRSRFADHPGLNQALGILAKIKHEPSVWDEEDENVS